MFHLEGVPAHRWHLDIDFMDRPFPGRSVLLSCASSPSSRFLPRAGTSYIEFVESVGLPGQMAQVDPIGASFCGGAIGVLSTLLLVEESNIKKQQKTRCFYCKGTGCVWPINDYR